jgi:hypothetical protein
MTRGWLIRAWYRFRRFLAKLIGLGDDGGD